MVRENIAAAAEIKIFSNIVNTVCGTLTGPIMETNNPAVIVTYPVQENYRMSGMIGTGEIKKVTFLASSQL